MDIQELVDQALDKWDNETNCGETDPAFDGDVGKDIDNLVYGLNNEQIADLLETDSPVVFVHSPNRWGSYETCNYLGKVVYSRSTRTFSLFDSRDNVIAHIDYDMASMVVGIFNVVSKEDPHGRK